VQAAHLSKPPSLLSRRRTLDVASASVPNATLPLMWLLTVVGDRQAGICLATPEEQREEREWHELVRRKSSAYGAFKSMIVGNKVSLCMRVFCVLCPRVYSVVWCVIECQTWWQGLLHRNRSTSARRRCLPSNLAPKMQAGALSIYTPYDRNPLVADKLQPVPRAACGWDKPCHQLRRRPLGTQTPGDP
jgi:hypothetical protein